MGRVETEPSIRPNDYPRTSALPFSLPKERNIEKVSVACETFVSRKVSFPLAIRGHAESIRVQRRNDAWPSNYSRAYLINDPCREAPSAKLAEYRLWIKHSDAIVAIKGMITTSQ